MRAQLSSCIAALALTVLHAHADSPTSVDRELTVFASEQQSVTPGYPVGNVAIGDPKIADFRVMPGRREVLVFGKRMGGTRLTLWDQQNVKRDEIVITVTTHEVNDALTTLRGLLREFPSVAVQQSSDSILVTGTVTAKDDQAAIEKIAAAVKAKSLVRYVPPDRGSPDTSSPDVSPISGVGAARPPVKGARGFEGPPFEVDYEIELLEASSKFRSGSYATGVEPSGRSLSREVVTAPIGADREVFIGGNTVVSSTGATGNRTASPSPGVAPTQTGIKLTLRPTSDGKGKFKTSLLIETNLPFAGDTYDPSVWRRSRWEFSTASKEPFGITGADLLATPDANDPQGSKLGATARTAAKVAMIPHVGSAPGAEYVPVFGSLFGSRSYKKKTTQLLIILRPLEIRPQP